MSLRQAIGAKITKLVKSLLEKAGYDEYDMDQCERSDKSGKRCLYPSGHDCGCWFGEEDPDNAN